MHTMFYAAQNRVTSESRGQDANITPTLIDSKFDFVLVRFRFFSHLHMVVGMISSAATPLGY